ncbi:hypothetical protein PAWBP_6290 [Paulownia witches'-broom phytoplasma]|nr:hypothetical protein PAWBP_6290 [Paulownia witches'-broom phytoplasma]
MNSFEFKTLIQQEKETTKITTNPFPQPHHSMKPKPPVDEQEINIKKKQLFKKISPLFNQIRDYYHYLLISNRNNESQPGLTYLTQKRKLTLETIKEFQLGYAPLSDKPLSFRLVNYCQKKNIKIDQLLEYGLSKKKLINKEKNIIMILSMVLLLYPLKMVIIKLFIFIKTIFAKFLTFNPKYQALTNFSQTPTFHFSYRFFEALTFIKQTKTIIIHEGFFDVISCWENNIKNVVGLICVTQLLSQSQLEILKKRKD